MIKENPFKLSKIKNLWARKNGSKKCIPLPPTRLFLHYWFKPKHSKQKNVNLYEKVPNYVLDTFQNLIIYSPIPNEISVLLTNHKSKS